MTTSRSTTMIWKNKAVRGCRLPTKFHLIILTDFIVILLKIVFFKCLQNTIDSLYQNAYMSISHPIQAIDNVTKALCISLHILVHMNSSNVSMNSSSVNRLLKETKWTYHLAQLLLIASKIVGELKLAHILGIFG